MKNVFQSKISLRTAEVLKVVFLSVPTWYYLRKMGIEILVRIPYCTFRYTSCKCNICIQMCFNHMFLHPYPYPYKKDKEPYIQMLIHMSLTNMAINRPSQAIQCIVQAWFIHVKSYKFVWLVYSSPSSNELLTKPSLSSLKFNIVS